MTTRITIPKIVAFIFVMTQFNACYCIASATTVVRCYHEGGKDGERDTFCVVTTAAAMLSIRRPFIRHDEKHASAKSTSIRENRILPFTQLKKNSTLLLSLLLFPKKRKESLPSKVVEKKLHLKVFV